MLRCWQDQGRCRSESDLVAATPARKESRSFARLGEFVPEVPASKLATNACVAASYHGFTHERGLISRYVVGFSSGQPASIQFAIDVI